MSEFKRLIVSNLNGGLALAVTRRHRTYMSTPIARACEGLHRAGISYSRSISQRGFPFPLDVDRYPDRLNANFEHILRNANKANVALITGKSCGAYNWLKWMNANSAALDRYAAVGVIFVDMNVGPTIQERVNQAMELTAPVDYCVNMYTRGTKWGGFLVYATNIREESQFIEYEVAGRNHFNVVKHDDIRAHAFNIGYAMARYY